MRLSRVEAERLGWELLGVILKNSQPAAMHGYLTIREADLRSGLVGWFKGIATDSSLDDVVVKTREELEKDQELLVRTEYGVWEQRRFDLASKIFRDLLSLQENERLEGDVLAREAVRRVDELLDAIDPNAVAMAKAVGVREVSLVDG